MYGKELMEKTSPDTRIGTLSPYFSVRSSSASRLMGVVEGVLRIRGWMVRKSMLRSCSWPRTVSIKSIVCLKKKRKQENKVRQKFQAKL